VPEISTTKRALPSAGRVTHALLVAAKGLVISIAKIIYALWLEVTGLIFGIFTVWAASSLVRQYRLDQFGDHKRLLVTSVMTVLFGWFTVVSFVRARKTRK
jgi:hypothetical protein